MRKPNLSALLPMGLAIVFINIAAVAQPSTPQAVSPYQLSVFATAPAGLSAPIRLRCSTIMSSSDTEMAMLKES